MEYLNKIYASDRYIVFGCDARDVPTTHQSQPTLRSWRTFCKRSGL